LFSFFLAEYASIVLMCILISILFLGGYLFDLTSLTNLNNTFINFIIPEWVYIYYPIKTIDAILEGLIYGITIGLKSCLMIFTFIWVRASFPRIRFDQLMSFCWTILLPIVVAFIVLIPCILYGFELIVNNLFLM